MFKVGDKAKGFKFDGDAYPLIGWADEMDDVVGVVGEVSYVGGESYSIRFKDSDVDWGYPKDLWYLAKVEETTVSDKVSFNVGDRVKFRESSLASGMIDATEDDVFNISHIAQSSKDVWIEEHLGWWSTEHIEHVKESTMTNTDDDMNNTEEQEIKWEVGQEVFCCVFGKGTVIEISKNGPYPLRVSFEHEENTEEGYTMEGKLFTAAKNRTLFFSDPKIEAEKFPPKKPFVPAFQKGDVIAVKRADTVQILILEQETERQVKGNCGQVWDKDPDVHFYKLGEEIKFN